MRKKGFDSICKNYGILAAYTCGSMSKEGAAFLEGKKSEKLCIVCINPKLTFDCFPIWTFVAD